jgi:hypothetical protein
MDKEGMLLYVFYVFDVIKTHDASLQLFVLFVNSLMFIKAGSRKYCLFTR